MTETLARSLATRIAALEAEIVTHTRAGNRQQALRAAHTATYLRTFAAEFIGPLWLIYTHPGC